MKARFKLALARWHEMLVYACTGLLLSSGIGWLLIDRFGRVEGDFGPETNPAEPWLLLLHGTAAYAFLVVVAMLIPVHMRLGWSSRRNRGSGIAGVTVAALLAASGLVLYYATAESLRAWTSTAHWVVGLAMPLLLGWHVVRGRSSR